MRLRRLICLSSLVLAVAAISAASALGKAKGADRPLSGTSTATVIIDLATGLGTGDGSGQLSHLGRVTVHDDFTSFTFTGPNTFSFTGTETIVAANGDKLFATTAATGTLTAAGSDVVTTVETITGGTGRFADASGTFTRLARGVIVSIVGSIATHTFTINSEGQISY
jgi:hypothetical protein